MKTYTYICDACLEETHSFRSNLDSCAHCGHRRFLRFDEQTGESVAIDNYKTDKRPMYTKTCSCGDLFATSVTHRQKCDKCYNQGSDEKVKEYKISPYNKKAPLFGGRPVRDVILKDDITNLVIALNTKTIDELLEIF